MKKTQGLIQRRIQTYWILGIGLTLLYLLLRGSSWRGSTEFHTNMESVAFFLAIIVGVQAMLRYYAHKDSTLLFVGMGFFGTGLLDGYHAVVTSTLFSKIIVSPPVNLIPWSWVASRLFLSVFIYMAYIVWNREQHYANVEKISEKTIYWIAGISTIACFAFFALYPLPRAYYPELPFHRPEEFIPAIFFALALRGFLRKGRWRQDDFEHWLIISLVIGVVSQTVFMSFSCVIFDIEFYLAHTLKNISYICVLVGLLISMFYLYQREEVNALWSKAIIKGSLVGIITIDSQGSIRTFSPAAEHIFGYTASEVIGQNISMLMPEPDHSRHDGYLHHHLETGENKIIGNEREVIGQRKDGAGFSMMLAVNRIELIGKIAFVGMVIDISKQKSAQSQLMQAERLASLGGIVAGVAHEINTPVGTAVTNISELADIASSFEQKLKVGIKKSDLDEFLADTRDFTHMALENLLRAAELVRSFKQVAVDQSSEQKREFNLLEHIQSTVTTMYHEFKRTQIKIRVDCPGELSITGLPGVYSQIVTNLMQNSRIHGFNEGTESGEILIMVRQVGNEIILTYTDNGKGMDEEQCTKTFEPFFTTRRDEGGSGLGMNIVHNLVTKTLGGKIELASVVGEGVRLQIVVPL